MLVVYGSVFSYLDMRTTGIVTVSQKVFERERLIHRYMPNLGLIKLDKNTICQNSSLYELLAVKYEYGKNVKKKFFMKEYVITPRFDPIFHLIFAKFLK